MTGEATKETTRASAWPIATLVLLAAALRLVHLDAGLWYDEIVNVVEYLRRPAADIVAAYAHANHHVMNSLLARASLLAFGESAWAIRLPAAAFGILGVWAFWFVARRVWTRDVALLATLSFAVSYPHIHYSQMARGYTAFVCFALLATGFVLRLAAAPVAGRSREDGAGYAVSVALGLYSLLLMAFVALGHGVVLLAAKRWRAAGWLAAGVAGGVLLYAPLLPDLVGYYRSSPTFTGHPLLSGEFMSEMGGLWIPAALAAVVGLLLVRRLGRRDPLFAALVSVPLALTILLPWIRGQGVHPRSFMYALPLAYLFLAEGLAWCAARQPLLARAVTGVVVLVSVAPLPRYYGLPKQGFEAALAHVSASRAPGEAVVGLSMGGKGARFYDPGVLVIEDEAALDTWLADRPGPAWILVTFAAQLERDHPRMAAWLEQSTEPRVVVEGVIGDGAVRVHWWPGIRPIASATRAMRRASSALIGAGPPVRTAR